MKRYLIIIAVVVFLLGFPTAIKLLDILFKATWLFITEVLLVYIKLPKDRYDFFQIIVEEYVVISKIKFINDLLFILASFAPSILSFYYFTLTNKSLKLNGSVSFSIYLLTVLLFQSTLFWIIVVFLFVLTVLGAFRTE